MKFKKKIKRYKISIFISTLAFVMYVGVVGAINTVNDGYMNIAGSTQTIDAYGVCQEVVNSGSNSYFIPTKTSEEWASFRNAAAGLVGISLQSCGEPPPPIWGDWTFGVKFIGPSYGEKLFVASKSITKPAGYSTLYVPLQAACDSGCGDVSLLLKVNGVEGACTRFSSGGPPDNWIVKELSFNVSSLVGALNLELYTCGSATNIKVLKTQGSTAYYKLYP